VDELLDRVENIGAQLQGYTNKLVFSFADIATYKKVENNLKREQIKVVEFSDKTMHEFAKGLKSLNEKWGYEIGTCAEKIPLEQYGIKHNKCIDDDLMIKLFSDDKPLMDFLGVKFEEPDLFGSSSGVTKTRVMKDKGQREACGCIISKDIGQYNTCPHECIYCYANTSIKVAEMNYKSHIYHPHLDTITGR
jgi:hypothetical protein